MIESKKKNIALLTGRGGSVSIKDKNVMPILGRPLLAYPYLAAKYSELIDDIYLSTDGDKLKEVAAHYDVKVIDRPPELAQPTSQHVDCIRHALGYLEQQQVSVEILVVLLCNVATHEVGAIDRAVSFLTEHPEYDSCVSVSEMRENHPAIAKRSLSHAKPLNHSLDNQVHYIAPFQNSEVVDTREGMRSPFFLTHSFWAIRVSDGLPEDGQPPWLFMGQRVAGYVMDQGRDVHDHEDSAFCECWLQARGWSPFENPHAERAGLFTDNVS